jgi:hypothetical protein
MVKVSYRPAWRVLGLYGTTKRELKVQKYSVTRKILFKVRKRTYFTNKMFTLLCSRSLTFKLHYNVGCSNDNYAK